jgi:transcription elongation factor GreA
LELEAIVRSAIITKDTVSSDKAVIGSTIKAKSDEITSEFKLVGASEASPLEGRISIESPLGRALLNHKKGETIEFETPMGKKLYEIISVG